MTNVERKQNIIFNRNVKIAASRGLIVLHRVLQAKAAPAGGAIRCDSGGKKASPRQAVDGFIFTPQI